MTHLGTQVSALADGQLSPEATERALAHVASCTECAEELRAARAAHRALAAAMDVPMAPALTARLLALGSGDADGEPSRSARARPSSSFEGSVHLPGGDRHSSVPEGCLRGDLNRRGVPSRVLLVVGTGVGVVVAGLLALGDQPAIVPSEHPAEAMSALGEVHPVAAGARLGGTSDVVAIDLQTQEGDDQVLDWMEREGWSCPFALPEGLSITEASLDDGALEIDLAGSAGRAVITERRGRLNESALAHVPVLEVEGRSVHVISTAPWHGVWQSGETVVDVVAQVPASTVEELVAAYPARDYDDSVPARISRGWTALAGAWSP